MRIIIETLSIYKSVLCKYKNANFRFSTRNIAKEMLKKFIGKNMLNEVLFNKRTYGLLYNLINLQNKVISKLFYL